MPPKMPFLLQILALPFLPHQHIEMAFDHIREQSLSAALQQLVNYVSQTRIDSSVWPPGCWSIFYQPIRTNNDVEGEPIAKFLTACVCVTNTKAKYPN